MNPKDAQRLMDGDHGELFSLVEEVRIAIDARDSHRVRQHLLLLYERERQHFAVEEEIMAYFEYAHAERHQQTHEELLTTIEALYRLLVIEDLKEIDMQLAGYLETTLAHTKHADGPLHAFLGELAADDD
ncbi:MAG: hypothetical protein R3316_04425 [Rhodovibrionaceae bacterium]|nr:hypothetical protein [Rhodovibrionaceae bacterium]